MKSPQFKTKKITELTLILLLAFTCNSFADVQLDAATEQRIIREQNRVIQNQQIAIEADQRKREAEIIQRQWAGTKANYEKEDFLISFGDFKLNEKQIKDWCSTINSINDLTNDEIPSELPLIDFFHIYLIVKALYPEHLDKFSCAEKLESQAIPLFSLEREPLEKPYPQSTYDLQILHLHREITRNLYKTVNVVSDANGEFIKVAGISNGLPFISEDQNLIQQVLNPKTYLKFTSNNEDHFIPLKNYQQIKISYIYNHRLSDSGLLLVKAVNELGLAPKSILPLIEKSLKSGSKDFCRAVKNPEKPIAVDQLNQKQKKMFDVLVKYCPEAIQIKVTESSKKTSDDINKKVNAR